MIDPPGRLRSWAVPLVPFLWSLGLSVATVGSTVFWQDSGFYLTAVHEFSVLYPHGFVLYLALCKAWTVVAAPVLGFTLAVHAFSILCAAAASSCIALAARALLRRVEPLASPNLAAIGAACLAATGYSFWHAAILAKTYALYYLALAALLWLMARAERKSEFLAMGAVLGLAWAAHPSATLLLPVMLAYAWARRDRIREWGWGFAAGVVGLAAVVAIAPALFLPLIAQRGTPYDFDSPRTVGAMVEFLRGKRFTDGQGAFGFDGSRSLQAAQFVWEEYLGVGLVLLGIGAARLARRRPGLLGLLVAWVLPVAGTALVYRAEGQLDQWLVAAYVPLALLLAAGLQALGARNLSMPGAALAGALLWMLASTRARRPAPRRAWRGSAPPEPGVRRPGGAPTGHRRRRATGRAAPPRGRPVRFPRRATPRPRGGRGARDASGRGGRRRCRAGPGRRRGTPPRRIGRPAGCASRRNRRRPGRP